MSLLASTLFACLLLLSVARADLIYGSGQGVNPNGGYTIDPHWSIVALPVTYGSNHSVPYAAYNPDPTVLYSGYAYRFGYTNNGVTNYWLAPNTTAASLQGGNYNWIAAQTFTITTAGYYSFNFGGTADNDISFYINGSITGTATEFPTITNGTKIGPTWPDFTTLKTFTGTAYLNAGTNTAYMVLNDFGGATTALITQSTFSVAPEPGTWAAAALLIGGAGYVRFRKRAKVA